MVTRCFCGSVLVKKKIPYNTKFYCVKAKCSVLKGIGSTFKKEWITLIILLIIRIFDFVHFFSSLQVEGHNSLSGSINKSLPRKMFV